MKIFLITSRPAGITLIKQAEQLGLCDVIAAWSGEQSLRDALQVHFPATRICSSWDELIAEVNQVERLVSCGGDPAIVEAARQLTAQGLACLHLIDPDGPPAAQFSLTSAWNERPDLVSPLLLNGSTAKSLELFKKLADLTKSPLHRIELTQTVSAQPGEQPTFSEADFDRGFFLASPLFRMLGGDYQEVTSLRLGVQGDRAEQGIITLAGEHAPDATWRLERGPTRSCRLVLKAEDLTTVEQTWNPQEALGADISLELASQQPCLDWSDLLRCGELSATAKISAAKRRTIRVQQEEGTERSQFKSQMTAIGCGVLMWAMSGTMLMLFAATVADPRDREYKTSTRHGFVLRDGEFTPHSGQLNAQGLTHLETISRRWSDTEAALIIEQAGGIDQRLMEERLDAVRNKLAAQQLREVNSRTISRELPGQWYEALLRLGWLVVFVPLILFLVVQGLILAARGPQT